MWNASLKQVEERRETLYGLESLQNIGKITVAWKKGGENNLILGRKTGNPPGPV